jgi:hypothetical protein
VKTALCAALAATFSFTFAPTIVAAKSPKGASNSLAAQPSVRPKGLTAGAQGQAAGKNNTAPAP